MTRQKTIYCCEICGDYDTSKSGMLAHMETHLKQYKVEVKTGKCILVEIEK